MNIVMTTDTVGGVWSYALELIRGLAPWHVNVTLATMGATLSPVQRAAAQQIPNLSICESDYKMSWMDDSWHDVEAAGHWLRAIVAQIQPDLIHFNHYAHAAPAWPVPTLVVGHSCVLSWWQAVKGESPPAEWERYRATVTAGVCTADLVVAPSGAMLASMQRNYGPLAATQVIYNGRNPQPYKAAPKEPFILTAGRLWDEAKNVAALAQVTPRLAWPVYVAGEQQHPSHGGVAAFDNVYSLGTLSPQALAAWLARASIYALPARYEPFGLSALEAALSGCALVLGDIASLREVWGDAALFIPPDDHAALAHTLQRLIADPHLRQTYARRAYNHAQAFTSAAMAERYYTVYRWLVSKSSAPKKLEYEGAAIEHPGTIA